MLQRIETIEVPAVASFSVPHMFRETATTDGVPFAYIDPKLRERFAAVSVEGGLGASVLGVCEVVQPSLAKDVYHHYGPACEVHPAHLFEFLKNARESSVRAIAPGSQFGPSCAVFMRDVDDCVWLAELYMATGGGSSWWCLHLHELYVPVWSVGARTLSSSGHWRPTAAGPNDRLVQRVEPPRPLSWTTCAIQYPERPYPRFVRGRKVLLGVVC